MSLHSTARTLVEALVLLDAYREPGPASTWDKRLSTVKNGRCHSCVSLVTRRLRSPPESAPQRPRRERRSIVLGLALVLAGCAARPTGYVDTSGAFNGPYGYSTTSMGRDEYSILVRANSVTPDERVAQIALLRAAHLTIEKGGNRFNIIHSESVVYQYQRIKSVGVFGAVIPVGTVSDEDKLAALVIHVSLPGTTPVAPDAIDAQQVVADLSSKLQP
jgi:hypothetical protein